MIGTGHITQERLREVLDYDPETGAFTWLVSNSNRVRVGDHAGCICKKHGYRLIGIDGVVYRASRLAVLYMTGDLPSKTVDHRNLNRLDDRWENLREASRSENQFNRGAQLNNRTGLKGVSMTGSGRYQSRIYVGGVVHRLGSYDTPEQAHAAYSAAAPKFHGDFARAK